MALWWQMRKAEQKKRQAGPEPKKLPKKKAQPSGNSSTVRFVNTLMPYDFYVDIYLLGKLKVFKKRKCLRIGSLFIPLSRVLWAIQHPDEVLLPTDDIHHKDLDPNNDHYDNLERIPHRPHMKMHRAVFKEKEADIREIRQVAKEDQPSMFSWLPRTGRKLFEQRTSA